ncbi:MAG TPA: 50S ribosomal protein L23 [Candidatus Nanoarchaeia archaeon]|nr:50S ribosomal protein L23 [Candidatus Nanoarchaeia archaeon]
MGSMNVIKHPLSTEKSIRMMENNNTLLFVVEIKANKEQIKKAIEQALQAKVERVNTFVTPRGEKRAYVKFSRETPALDIATKLGLM